MIADTVSRLAAEISQPGLMKTVGLLAEHHRIQASAGYREAACALADHARSLGLEARVDSYPAAYGLRYMTMPVFEAWHCRQAACILTEPEVWTLADFEAEPMSLMQKSFAFHGEQPLELVLLDRGSEPQAYQGLDLRGKVIFVRDDFNAYLDWAVEKGGAVGIISDYVVENPGARTRRDMLDVRKYTTFWWNEQPDMAPFGFVITPRMGDRLAELCRQEAQAGRTPRLTCRVDADFGPGSFENTVCTLPGTGEQEIWLVAHLCHPKPSANDNASGVAAVLEAMAAIKRLTDGGQLPPLGRTVRALFIPEFTGLYAHLSQAGDVSHVKAALNLDMVGGRQDLGYGPLTLSGLSYASPSMAFEVARAVLDVLRQEVPGFSATARVPRFNSATCGFTAGSDHFILQDPTVGIPAPMLGQWPDIFYHTSGDSVDKISPPLLAKSAALAAGYAYLMSTLDGETLEAILARACAAMVDDMARLTKDGPLPRGEAARRLFGFYRDSARSALTLVPDAAEPVAQHERRLEALLAAMDAGGAEAPGPQDGRVPCRLYRGPVNSLADFVAGDPARQRAVESYATHWRYRHRDVFVAEVLTQYYIDGRRPLGEIADWVLLECGGGSREAVVQYVETLAALGLCSMETDPKQEG